MTYCLNVVHFTLSYMLSPLHCVKCGSYEAGQGNTSEAANCSCVLSSLGRGGKGREEPGLRPSASCPTTCTAALSYHMLNLQCVGVRKGRWPDFTQLSAIGEKHPVSLSVKVLEVPVSRQRKY